VITEGILSVIAGFVSFIGGLFPEVSVPGFVSDLSGLVSDLAGIMAPMGDWIPFASARNATLAVVGAILVALTIKFVRVLLSLFTGGGGGAA
jgi:hypothetical protein